MKVINKYQKLKVSQFSLPLKYKKQYIFIKNILKLKSNNKTLVQKKNLLSYNLITMSAPILVGLSSFTLIFAK